MKVEIESKRLIVPSSPTPPHLRNFKISAMDQHSEIYVPFIYYYLANDNEYSGTKIGERNNLLEKSLADTLTIFPHFAGRYIKEKMMIDSNDHGVQYLEAQVHGPLCAVLVNDRTIDHTDPINLLVPLRYEWTRNPASGDEVLQVNIIESDTSPLIFVQVNKFECGGLALGFCISHRIADGFTMTTFVNKWAQACRDQGIHHVKCLEFNLSSLLPPKEIPETVSLPILPDRRVITKRFVFDGSSIQRLKEMVQGSKSRVKVVTALLWKTRIKMNQVKNGCLRPSIITVPMNLRGKTVLPVNNSGGNLTRIVISRFLPNVHQGEVSFSDLFSILDGALSQTIADCAKVDAESLFRRSINEFRMLSEEVEKGEANVFMSSTWCGFRMYEADFGWGKPALVTGIPFFLELIWLMDTKDGDGVEAWVSLLENEMQLFQQDPDIAAFTSQAGRT